MRLDSVIMCCCSALGAQGGQHSVQWNASRLGDCLLLELNAKVVPGVIRARWLLCRECQQHSCEQQGGRCCVVLHVAPAGCRATGYCAGGVSGNRLQRCGSVLVPFRLVVALS